jgi:threonine dehydratase
MIGMEIVLQNPGPLHFVFVPIGGSGLIFYIVAYIKKVQREVWIICAGPTNANAMALYLHHG